MLAVLQLQVKEFLNSEIRGNKYVTRFLFNRGGRQNKNISKHSMSHFIITIIIPPIYI